MQHTRLAVAMGVLLAISAAGSALARSPITTGAKRNFHGHDPVTYQRAGAGGAAWWADTVDIELEDNFHSLNKNNTGLPWLDHDGSGTATVIYRDQTYSPCGTESSGWLACADNPQKNENWIVYVRDLSPGAEHPIVGGVWKEETDSCSGSSACWYLKRALIHELGHAMAALNHADNRPESDTVMNPNDPPIGASQGGYDHYRFQPCDEAAVQLVWDLYDKGEHYADCFTSGIDNLGPTGLKTRLTTAYSTFYACPGETVGVTGRLDVWDYDSYKKLGGNGLWDRKVWFDRFSTTHYASAVVASGGGDNWAKNLPTGNYEVYFDQTDAGAADAGNGLSDSASIGFTVVQLNPGACQ